MGNRRVTKKTVYREDTAHKTFDEKFKELARKEQELTKSLVSKETEIKHLYNKIKDQSDLKAEVLELKDQVKILKQELKERDDEADSLRARLNNKQPSVGNLNTAQVINQAPETTKQLAPVEIQRLGSDSNNRPVRLPKIEQVKGKVSVIITNFNTEKYVTRAIDSVINQTYQNVEILVIDDNSTDDSISVLSKYSEVDKVHIYRSPKNVGPYWLKNYLLSKLNGEFVTVLDSDDIDLPTKLEEQVAELTKDPNIQCVTCSYQRHGGATPSLGWPAMMYRRSVFDKIGYYDSVRFAADSEFYYRFVSVWGIKSVKHINKVLQKGPRREEGLTGIYPESSTIRKEYHKNYTRWHRSTPIPYMEWNSEQRPFPVDPKMLNLEVPNPWEVEKIEKPTDVLPVVMCVWKRIDGFETAVEQFNNQTFTNFKLWVWNNNQELAYKTKFRQILEEKALFEWELFDSPENIGGFGRFYWAREVYGKPGFSNWNVFVDDDQRWGPNLLQTFISERKGYNITSQFGWKFDGDDYYRNRVLQKPGEPLHYAGTGGMILHSRVLEDPRLYDTLAEHWWVEDLWLCYWANKYHGYSITKSRAEVKNGDDEHSLYRRVKDTKTPMLRWLLSEGEWNILD